MSFRRSHQDLPSGIVNNTVCVISGEYVDHDVDVCLQGPEPLVFQRSYCSTPKHRNMGLGWSHNQRGMAASTTSFDEDDDDEPIYLTSWIPETHNDIVQLQFNLTGIEHLYFI